MSTDLNKLKYLSGLTESYDQETKVVIGHKDREPHGLARDFNKICRYAQELEYMMKALPDNADLPHWIQSKVARANDYISTVKHYLEYEIDGTDDLYVSQHAQEGNAFTAALANTEKGEEFEVGGKTFKNRTDIGEDVAFESWYRELQRVLTENSEKQDDHQAVNENNIDEVKQKFDLDAIQENLEIALSNAIGVQVNLGRLYLSSGRNGPIVQFISSDLASSMKPKMFTKLHLTDEATVFSVDTVSIVVQYQWAMNKGGTKSLRVGTFVFNTSGKLAETYLDI